MGDRVYIPKTDADFEDWQREHPDGYVINAAETTDGEMMWHQSKCWHMYGANGLSTYMNRDKICATNPASLALWAKERSNPLTYCQTCQAEWAKRG